MSIVVSRDLAYGEIRRKIKGLKIAELMNVSLIDVYEGKNIPEGKISLTVRLTFQDPERTLTIDRVQNFVDTVLSLLKQTFDAELRSI
jgi:phenylalanyl-tRNA synthetase beta chain